jgi:hypothetical protein
MLALMLLVSSAAQPTNSLKDLGHQLISSANKFFERLRSLKY